MILTDNEKMQFEVINENLLESAMMLSDLAKKTQDKLTATRLSATAIMINSILIPSTDYDILILAPLVARLLTKSTVPINYNIEANNETTKRNNWAEPE